MSDAARSPVIAGVVVFEALSGVRPALDRVRRMVRRCIGMAHDARLLAHDPFSSSGAIVMTSFWTEQRDVELTRLFEAGLSCSQIAVELGAVSRNAVIGRLHRKGMRRVKELGRERIRNVRAGRPRPSAGSIIKPPITSRRHKRLAPDVNPIEFAPKIAVEIAPLRKTLVELSSFECRYPFDATDAERRADGLSYRYCGHATSGAGSWCPAHRRLAKGIGTHGERAATKRPRL